MNFLGMGPMELMMILVLALIVFGPSKLPEMAGQVGKAVRDFRRATSELSGEFNRTLSLEVEERKATSATPPAAPAEPATAAAAEPIAATPTVVAPPVTASVIANSGAPASPATNDSAPATSIGAPLSSQPVAVAELSSEATMPSANGASTSGASARSKRVAARRPIDSELVPPY